MTKESKSRALCSEYVSPNQLVLPCLECPFGKQLDLGNQWFILAGRIPWDEIGDVYLKHVSAGGMGRPGLSSHIASGSLMIKHLCSLDDHEAIQQISENMSMERFLGYSTFTTQVPFDASLFVDLRKRTAHYLLILINGRIVHLHDQGMKLQNNDGVVMDPITTMSGKGNVKKRTGMLKCSCRAVRTFSARARTVRGDGLSVGLRISIA